MEENPQETLLSLNVDYDAGNILKETVRWTKFISIVSIVGLALVALVLAFAGSYLVSAYSQVFPGILAFGSAIIFVAFVFIAILGFMVYLLFRFSSLVKKGIETQDQGLFNSGLQSL